jgi:C4-dicarboxylate-specific signal transduction histidine kinase
LIAGETVCFSRVEDLPAEAFLDVQMFRVKGTRSGAYFPLAANGHTFGALAFATLESERSWRDDVVAELKLVAQIIGNVVGRQRAEVREEQLRDELAHAMRVASLGELAATIAHELNQPLAAILSNAQAARRFIADGEIESGEMRAILDDIVRDDKRAGNVIHNLRAMVGKRHAQRENCSVNELVREVMELLRAEMIGEKIEMRASLAPALPEVQVARVELQQVLMNLLINAVQAMKDTRPANRFVEIETSAIGTTVQVSIGDRGHGIPAGRLESIFEPFFSTKSEGLGMGLSICRRIIESHGGRIGARNHHQGGATFSFSLPVVTAG